MDALRFDAWTRRRIGLAAGGLAASLLARDSPESAARKRKKKRCVQVGAPCRNAKKARRCCRGLACDVTPGGPGRACCHRQRQTACNDDFECCGDQVLCTDRIGEPAFRCLGILGASCAETADCAGSLECESETCQFP